MDESNKAMVRQFLSSPAGRQWIDEGRRGCPRLDLASVPIDNYNASLLIKEGWLGHERYLENLVQQTPDPHYGSESLSVVED